MNRQIIVIIRRCLAGVSVLVGAPALLCAQSVTWLGFLPGGTWSGARSVSDDGTVIVGQANNDRDQTRAFRWSIHSGIQDLGSLHGSHSSWAYDVTSNGTRIVGWSRGTSGDVATVWTQGLPQSLGVWYGNESWASGVSDDGHVVVGVAIGSDSRRQAVRWRNPEGIQNLGTLGGNLSEAYAVSSDGTTVVGFARLVNGYDIAFRWTQESGMHSLGTLEGGSNSRALGVSADGSVVVGWSRYRIANFVPYRAFRWTLQTGMQNLGELSPYDISVVAYGVSADGTIVIGSALEQRDNQYRYRAFIWNSSNGMLNLNEIYAHLLVNSSSLTYAYGISGDGRYIVGQGRNGSTNRTEAFLLDTWRTGDTNGDGCIDDQDLLAVLFAFGTSGSGLTRHEDINKDGTVDDADLLVVLFNFGC